MSRLAGDRAPGVICVTDRRAAGGRPIADLVRASVAAGADMVQIREKDLAGGPLLLMVKEAVAIAREAGARCRIIVNDRLDVALAAKASGAHLPAEGLPVGEARRKVGPRFLLGRSVHSLAEARQAEKEKADYLIFGPIFATPSKAGLGAPHGPEGLRKLLGAVRVPIYAIGGINLTTIEALRGIPIAGIAAIGAIASAEDPGRAIRELRAALAGE